jgi:protein-tyrosine phosphatase
MRGETMKTLIASLIILSSIQLAQAGLKSPFQSTVEGINIPNTHYVSQDETVLRGMAPTGHLEELLDFGITDVLIFKNQTRNEIDKEVKKLKELGYEDSNIHQINFRWKEYESMQVACEQTIEALQIIEGVRAEGNSIFFHCTVGEDRTGLLSGVYRMMSENMTRAEVFQEEMCEKGYEAGNSNKPWVVVNAIRKDLTPLFKKMAKGVDLGMISLDKLDTSACSKIVKLKTDRKKLACKKSSRLND